MNNKSTNKIVFKKKNNCACTDMQKSTIITTLGLYSQKTADQYHSKICIHI